MLVLHFLVTDQAFVYLKNVWCCYLQVPVPPRSAPNTKIWMCMHAVVTIGDYFARHRSFVTQSGVCSGRQDKFRCMHIVEVFVCDAMLFLAFSGLKDYVLCAWYTLLIFWGKSQAREPWCDWVLQRGHFTYCWYALTCGNSSYMQVKLFVSGLCRVHLLTAWDQVELCIQPSSCVLRWLPVKSRAHHLLACVSCAWQPAVGWHVPCDFAAASPTAQPCLHFIFVVLPWRTTSAQAKTGHRRRWNCNGCSKTDPQRAYRTSAHIWWTAHLGKDKQLHRATSKRFMMLIAPKKTWFLSSNHHEPPRPLTKASEKAQALAEAIHKELQRRASTTKSADGDW